MLNSRWIHNMQLVKRDIRISGYSHMDNYHWRTSIAGWSSRAQVFVPHPADVHTLYEFDCIIHMTVNEDVLRPIKKALNDASG